MPRSLNSLVNELLRREDTDRGHSRHRFHNYDTHHDPLYMSGGLHPSDDIGGHARRQGGLRRNQHHGGWDLQDDWHGGRVSHSQRDQVRDTLTGMFDGLSLNQHDGIRDSNTGMHRGSRRSRLPSYSVRDTEQGWNGYPPVNGSSTRRRGSRSALLSSYSLRDAERDWYEHAPVDGFSVHNWAPCASCLPAYTMRDAERDWYSHPPIDGFSTHHESFRDPRFPSYGMREAERNWYIYAPADSFDGYHQSWNGSGSHRGYWW